MNTKQILRSKLYRLLNRRSKNLKNNVFLLTYIRAFDSNTLEIEFCQKRCIDKRIFTGRYVLPELNQGHYTLLFNRLKMEPKTFLEAFPELDLSFFFLQQVLNEGAKYYKDEVVVYPEFKIITKYYDGDFDRFQTPIIIALEYTKSELRNLENVKELEALDFRDVRNQNNLLNIDRIPIIDGKTGEGIYRFTKMDFIENEPSDRIIEYKLRSYDYETVCSGKSYLSWSW